MVEQALGWTATVIFSAMLIPQIVKTARLRTLEGVSLGMHGMYFCGNVVALAYAMLIGQWPLIIKYVVALVSVVVFLVVVWRVWGKHD